MRTFFPLSVLALVGWGSCSSPAASPALSPQPVSVGCHADNDCKGDRICIAGACVSPQKADAIANVDSIKNPNVIPDPSKISTSIPTDQAKEEARKAAKAAKEKEREEKSLYRTDKLTGTVEDKEAGLVWAASDNGSKVTWQEARTLCSERGRGWNLPSIEQIKTLYANGDTEHAPKEDPAGLSIHHPKDININGYFLWSKESTLLGNNGAVVDLHDGTKQYSQTKAYALCIRVD